MSGDTLIWLALVIPLIGAALIAATGHSPNLRETVTLVTAGGLFFIVIRLLVAVMGGERPETLMFTVGPGLELGFRIEPLGMVFGVVGSTLWIVNSIYSIGYMRGHNEPRQTSFYVCFAIAIFGVIGVAFSANLVTLFLFYEILTLSTYPLVTHKGDDKARQAGRIYLMILLGTSMVLLLPAIIWTGVAAGTVDFTPGGVLGGAVSGPLMAVLLALFMFGIGKAALMPFHYWLPAAMVAPTPVSALLHAVAVVKAGVFAVVKVAVYIFGIETLAETGASEWLVFVAAFSLLGASVVALTRDNLKARLAYSTVSQLAYVVLGTALATQAAIIGSGLQIVMHATGKITLFFCAGAIMVATHKTEVSDMTGIGRRMPITMTAFLIGSLSIIGLPPLGGTWSKWWLSLGALEAGEAWVLAVFMLSSLLSAAYLLPIVARGFFLSPPEVKEGAAVTITEAPTACLIALCVTAAFCVVLFFGAGYVEDLLASIDFAPEQLTTSPGGDRDGP